MESISYVLVFLIGFINIFSLFRLAFNYFTKVNLFYIFVFMSFNLFMRNSSSFINKFKFPILLSN